MAFDIFPFTKTNPNVWGFNKRTLAIDGLSAASIKWQLALFTKKGSNISDPEYGSNFLDNLKKNYVTNDDNLRTTFDLAAREVIDWMRDTNINSEFIVSAELLHANKLKDKIVLTVKLTGSSGEATSFNVPVEI